MPTLQKIRTFLWFDDQAEEAMNFYVSIFKNSEVIEVSRYGSAGPGADGSVMTCTFQLDGQQFIALNGGPMNKFNEAISLFVTCDTQDEIDELWAKLSDGGEEGQCGWLTDKFGLSWQIVPAILMPMLHDKNKVRSQRVMAAMLKMQKMDMAILQDVYQDKVGRR